MIGEAVSPKKGWFARGATVGETVLIFAIFAAYGAWLAPDGNETYYLGKAKHFWDPEWGKGVLFLESRNAHTVFYALTGWMARYLSLEQMAWMVRDGIWVLLAMAWQRFSFAVVPRRGVALISAALLLALNERGNMAGEWIVGGAEAKGFAYGFVLLGLERFVREDARRAFPLLGLATCFHPLVGGWAFLAGAVAWTTVPQARGRGLLPLGLGILLALPGLWWAVRLNAGTDLATIERAAQIIVFERAPHHLLPAAFSSQAIIRHLCLWGAWFWLLWVLGRTSQHRLWSRFVTAAIGISALGLLVGLVTSRWPLLAATLLQYYWFRLADVIVPAGLAVLILRWADTVRSRHLAWGRVIVIGLVLLGVLNLGQRVKRIEEATAPRSDWTLAHPNEWFDVCEWASHTLSEFRFLTPSGGASFLWYSGRRDIVNWKDVPQDAEGIVAWWECMREIHGEGSTTGPRDGRPRLNELSASRLQELGRTYGADYAIVDREGHSVLDLPRVYENTAYLVYRLVE